MLRILTGRQISELLTHSSVWFYRRQYFLQRRYSEYKKRSHKMQQSFLCSTKLGSFLCIFLLYKLNANTNTKIYGTKFQYVIFVMVTCWYATVNASHYNLKSKNTNNSIPNLDLHKDSATCNTMSHYEDFSTLLDAYTIAHRQKFYDHFHDEAHKILANYVYLTLHGYVA